MTPTPTEPKANVEVPRRNFCTPVPVRASGRVVEFAETLSADGAAPVAVGVKITVKAQDVLFGTGFAQEPSEVAKDPTAAGMVGVTGLPE